MSFGGGKTVVREVSAPPPPPPDPGKAPPSPPKQADAAQEVAAYNTNVSANSRAGARQNATGTPQGDNVRISGTRSLVNTSTQGLARKADTRKRSLLGGA